MKSISAITIGAFLAMVLVIAKVIIFIHVWIFLAAILMSGAWGVHKTLQIIRMGPQARQYIPTAIRVKLTWRYVARHVDLAYVDPHFKGKSRLPFGPAIGEKVRISTDKTRVTTPRIKVKPDAFGVVCKVKTIPRVTREDVEDKAKNLADYWKCARVGVTQASPGRLIVRGLRNDPLAVRMSMEDAPPDTYTKFDPHSLYVGRDEWADHRGIDLSGITGISVTGLQGYGKTSLILSWLCQLAGTGAVQFVLVDGKGSADYLPWIPRAWMHCGDSLEDAEDILEKVHDLMRVRLDNIEAITGHSNGWVMGPTPECPLIVTVIDEAHSYMDPVSFKGDKQAEPHIRRITYLAGQLVKKGRSAMFLSIFMTQKGSGEAIPTGIRDLCQLGFSFATTTRAAAVCGLGEGIRDFPTYCPTGLRDRSMIGVLTATMPSGSDPFCRIRVPEVTEQAAKARAAATAACRIDPGALVAHLRKAEEIPV